MKKIVIIGAGAMGSAFTVPCVDNDNDVTLIGTHLENELITSIKKNKNFHPALKTNLPSKLKIERFENLKAIIEKGVDVIIAAVSSIGIKWFAEEISKFYKKKLPIVLLTKGLSVENDELITLSEKISILLKEKGHNEINISAIKGPCLATGLANKMRTGTVIANPDIKEAHFLKKIIKILEEKKNIPYKYKKKIYNFKYLDLGYVDSLELISFVFNIEKNFKIRNIF